MTHIQLHTAMPCHAMQQIDRTPNQPVKTNGNLPQQTKTHNRTNREREKEKKKEGYSRHRENDTQSRQRRKGSHKT